MFSNMDHGEENGRITSGGSIHGVSDGEWMAEKAFEKSGVGAGVSGNPLSWKVMCCLGGESGCVVERVGIFLVECHSSLFGILIKLE